MRIKPQRRKALKGRYINFRLTEEEHRTLTAKAKAARMSKSALLRDHIGRLRITPRADRREVLQALARVGSNLNQLARWANTQKGGLEALAVVLRLWKVEEELRAVAALAAGREDLEAAS